jgi:hypothetical protein
MTAVALAEVVDHTLKLCQVGPPSTSEERNDKFDVLNTQSLMIVTISFYAYK